MTNMLDDTLLLDARTGWRNAYADATLELEGVLRLAHVPVPPPPPDPGVAYDPDGCKYVLVEDGTRIAKNCKNLPCIGGRGAKPRELDGARGIDISCHYDLFVADTGNRRVQVFALKGLPLRAIWEDPGVGLPWDPVDVVAACDGNVFVIDRANDVAHRYDCHGMWSAATPVADVPEKRQPELPQSTTLHTNGVFISEALDSRVHNCQWHRIVLRGTLVAGTTVRVDTFTSESPKTIEEIRALPDARWATRQSHTIAGNKEWDCLVLSVPGRYLWLRLTLTGDGAGTPEITSIRAYFPRSSSLRYLPAVYSEDAVSRDFLARFLSIFDTVRDRLSARIANIAAYFDPASAPDDSGADFLAWLGSWVGMALDRHWPEARRRALLKNAHRLYELRGTPEGLRLHIELYTGRKPQILEHFKLRRWTFLGDARLGDCSALYGASIVKRLQLGVHDRIGEFQLVDSGDPLRDPFHVYAHQFTVVVPASKKEDAELQRRTLERIIELAKPAYTKGDLQVTEGRLRIGIQSFIGVDTIISDYPAEVVEGTRRLGFDAVLGRSEEEAKPPAMRVGGRTRIGSGTVLR